MREPVVCWKAAGKEARRARIVFTAARPEHSIFAADAVVGDTGIIGDAAGRSAAQFVESSFGRGRDGGSVGETRT